MTIRQQHHRTDKFAILSPNSLWSKESPVPKCMESMKTKKGKEEKDKDRECISREKSYKTATIKKARVPPKSISRQLRMICHELLK